MIDIQQVKKDFENGVLISRATWEKVIEAAMQPTAKSTDVLIVALENIASIENKMHGGDWDEIEEARAIAKAALPTAMYNK